MNPVPAGEVVVRLRGVRKEYQALRPLRIRAFELRQGEKVALLGLDRAAAEVLVNLVTAATLPDAGDVDVFGEATSAIADVETWFRSLDRFGVHSERVVLLEELSVAQNLALPLSLELDRLPAGVRTRVERLAADVGIRADDLDQPMTAAGSLLRARVRLGKALAVDPRVLLVEHPNAAIAADEAMAFARDLATVADARNLGMVVLTSDPEFAQAACGRVLTLRPATGELAASGWRRWFGK